MANNKGLVSGNSHTPPTQCDVLVVGGGVNGTGIAMDAAGRGLQVVLCEMNDLASATSSSSSKLIHGGLRYLEMMDFGLVREALQERGLLLTRLAPHLVSPVPFLYPLTKPVLERAYVGAGLALYDGMAKAGKYDMGVPMHRHLTRRQVARMAPDFKAESITGAIKYYDCQVDDARMVVAVARTAYWPSLSLTGSAGYASSSLGDLFDGDAVYNLAASLSQLIFDGGQTRGENTVARAAWLEQVAGYRGVLLTALSEVDQGLGNINALDEQGAHRREALTQARRGFEIAETRYREGDIELTSVLDAQTSLISARQNLLDLRYDQLVARVTLYRVLGQGLAGPL